MLHFFTCRIRLICRSGPSAHRARFAAALILRRLPERNAMASRAALKRPLLPANTDRDVRIVGIGASAGGLDAFLELVSALPAGSGMAFVLIQPPAPRHDSLLVDILAGATSLPV